MNLFFLIWEISRKNTIGKLCLVKYSESFLQYKDNHDITKRDHKMKKKTQIEQKMVNKRLISISFLCEYFF